MGLFNRNDINKAAEECRNSPDGVLLDVRETDEFEASHIPGAVNVPLSKLHTITIEKDRPLYIYCLRGTRSRQAAAELKKMGYQNVRSIGGIVSYHGELEY